VTLTFELVTFKT